MPLVEPLYKHNQTIIKVLGYGDHKTIKLETFKSLRTSGLEVEKKEHKVDLLSTDLEKSQSNISRARTSVYEYAFCNQWQYFFTGTIDSRKLDRTNLDEFRKAFSKFINNLNCNKGLNIKYLIVPELHFDGINWHIHGLLNGLPSNQVKPYKLNQGLINKSIVELLEKGTQVYYWQPYQEKFGFCDLTEVESIEKISKYITKYISKDIGKSVTELDKHLYYCSKGLNKAETIKKGTMLYQNIVPDFENDYVAIKSFPYDADLLQSLCDNIITTMS